MQHWNPHNQKLHFLQTFTESGASHCSQFMLIPQLNRHQLRWLCTKSNKTPLFQNLFLSRRCIHITFHCCPVLLWCCFIGEFCIFKSQIIPCFASDRGEANIEKTSIIQPRFFCFGDSVIYLDIQHLKWANEYPLSSATSIFKIYVSGTFNIHM